MILEPVQFQPYVPPRSSGNALSRGLHAIFSERRLPYAIRRQLDGMMTAIGARSRTRRVGPYRVTFRRRTMDENFVESVLEREEYFRAGYTPVPGELIIDIGANIGTFTLAAARRGAKVIAVEPFPENVRYLRRNVRQNRIDARIIEGAVAAQKGICNLFVSLQTGTHSLVFDDGRGSLTVPAVTLDEVIADAGSCDLLKIDCEGAEFDFLPTLLPETWQKIRRIVMEYSAPVGDPMPTAEFRDRKREVARKLVQLIVDHGFRIDAWEDCAGFRAGYIFATRTASS